MPLAVIPEWTVGDRLRKARELTGLNIKEFSAEVGISRNTITKYEAGEELPRPVYLRAWAMRTGVDVTWLEHGAAHRRTKSNLSDHRVIIGPWAEPASVAAVPNVA
jgi:transcriptional regulator with XRE-family HTH domain